MGAGLAALPALALALAAPVALVVLVGLSRITVPVPDGDPLVLARSDIVGTWQDEQGGRLVLAADGTFAAADVCGDYSDAATGAGAGFDLASVKTGTGTWESTESDFPGENTTEVRAEFGPGDVWTQYEARGSAAVPVLWTYIGDPDAGELCVLKKGTTR
ncbi:hypothetical protein [Streptomyces sp. NPDC002133]|uniref:hypothetical protein n=1 Tax=Streptomyces sp. NPDC002133 TaxID=3154409 RepID=UPI00331736A5